MSKQKKIVLLFAAVAIIAMLVVAGVSLLLGALAVFGISTRRKE